MAKNKLKKERIPVDNIQNEPIFVLNNIDKIKEERQYLLETIFKDDKTIQSDIENIEKTLQYYKEFLGEGINKSIKISLFISIIHNNMPFINNQELINDDDNDHLKTTAGNSIEKEIIRKILQPSLNGTLHPNGAYQFPDWEYNDRYIDIKSVLVERTKYKYQSKFNSPKYNNAIEDSSQVLKYLYNNFVYKNNDIKSYKFCHSLLLYCFYEIFNNSIRVLDFIVVPTIQAISTTIENNNVILSEKNKGTNTNTRISLQYNKSIKYRTDNLFNALKQ